ncbi:MAG: hypothetical protein JWN78_1771 [Bacteroidota bacterium]|nr:hypothetical protein [Bacteroidota bacterium]
MDKMLITAMMMLAVSCRKSESTTVTCICRDVVSGTVVSNQTFPDTSGSAQCTAMSNYSQSCRLE